MSKAKKVAIAMSVILIVIICFSLIFNSIENPKRYSLEKHTKIISERVQRRYFKEDTKFTGYKLYPLYNANEELSYFLVEFEPYGFVFVSINLNWAFYLAKYYRYDSLLSETWRRFRVCLDGNEPEQYEGKAWLKDNGSQFENERYETDGEGNFIEYNHSPYAIANVLNQKMYLLNVYQGFVPAVKYNGKFINLVSMEEFEYINDIEYYKELVNKYQNDRVPPRLDIVFYTSGGRTL